MGRQVPGPNSAQEISRTPTGHLGRDCEAYCSPGFPHGDGQGAKKCQEVLHLPIGKRQLVNGDPHIAIHDRPENPSSIQANCLGTGAIKKLREEMKRYAIKQIPAEAFGQLSRKDKPL